MIRIEIVSVPGGTGEQSVRSTMLKLIGNFFCKVESNIESSEQDLQQKEFVIGDQINRKRRTKRDQFSKVRFNSLNPRKFQNFKLDRLELLSCRHQKYPRFS